MLLRIYAIILRFIYLHRRSIPRVMEIFFWPFMNLLVWGFLTVSIEKITQSVFLSYLIGGIIMWDVLYRAQQSITLSITDEFWARNIINLFISPIRIHELVIGVCIVGLVKSIMTTTLMGLLAFLIFGFSLLKAGIWLFPFYANLMIFGWAIGLITMGLIFKYGRAAEALIWGIPFLIQPFTGVFYPVEVLPAWIQPVSYLLPSTHVFEGMRNLIHTGHLDFKLLYISTVLNLPWLLISSIFFGWMLSIVRDKGYLSRQLVE